MSTALIIVIVIAVVIVGIIIATMLRRRAAEREIERQRLAEEARTHRETADVKLAASQDHSGEAERARVQAEEHAARAEEHAAVASEQSEAAARLDEQGQDAGHAAAVHEQEAAERERKLS